MTASIKIKNESYDPDHAPFRGLSSRSWHLMQSTRVQNLTILASTIPDISLGGPRFKWVTWPFVIHMLRLDIACVQNLTTLSSAIPEIWLRKILYDSHDLTGLIFYPMAGTCYDQPAYQIWSIYFHPLRRYKARYKMLKLKWFGVVRGHQRSQK